MDKAFAPAFRDYVKGLYGAVEVPVQAIPQILEIMLHDKKNSRKGINFTLLEAIGEASIDHYLDPEAIRRSILFYNAAGAEGAPREE